MSEPSAQEQEEFDRLFNAMLEANSEVGKAYNAYTVDVSPGRKVGSERVNKTAADLWQSKMEFATYCLEHRGKTFRLPLGEE